MILRLEVRVAGRKVVAEEAEALLDELAVSGMTVRAFAQGKGIDGRSLTAWLVNARRRRGEAPAASRASPAPLRLVEVVPASPAVAGPLVVRCGRLEVEVCVGIDDALLRQVLAAMATC